MEVAWLPIVLNNETIVLVNEQVPKNKRNFESKEGRFCEQIHVQNTVILTEIDLAASGFYIRKYRSRVRSKVFKRNHPYNPFL